MSNGPTITPAPLILWALPAPVLYIVMMTVDGIWNIHEYLAPLLILLIAVALMSFVKEIQLTITGCKALRANYEQRSKLNLFALLVGFLYVVLGSLILISEILGRYI